ncbi:MAG TPA: hypothetical protein VJP78_00165, partial [Thermoleophilia bacterium]|nr:hypothetical protein [Thermoleophilia bacterium]
MPRVASGRRGPGEIARFAASNGRAADIGDVKRNTERDSRRKRPSPELVAAGPSAVTSHAKGVTTESIAATCLGLWLGGGAEHHCPGDRQVVGGHGEQALLVS